MPLWFLLNGRGHHLPFALKLRRLLPCDVSGFARPTNGPVQMDRAFLFELLVSLVGGLHR